LRAKEGGGGVVWEKEWGWGLGKGSKPNGAKQRAIFTCNYKDIRSLSILYLAANNQ